MPVVQQWRSWHETGKEESWEKVAPDFGGGWKTDLPGDTWCLQQVCRVEQKGLPRTLLLKARTCYNQAALLDAKGESDRPGDPSEKSAGLNTASRTYSKLQQHLDSRCMNKVNEKNKNVQSVDHQGKVILVASAQREQIVWVTNFYKSRPNYCQWVRKRHHDCAASWYISVNELHCVVGCVRTVHCNVLYVQVNAEIVC